MHNIPATGKQLMAKKPQGLRRAEQNESLVRDIHIIAPERKEKKKNMQSSFVGTLPAF